MSPILLEPDRLPRERDWPPDRVLSSDCCSPDSVMALPAGGVSTAITKLPCPSFNANSTDSAARARMPFFISNRSMTTSMSCRIRRSSGKSSFKATTIPSTRARANPCFSRSTKRSRYSPFCPRMIGARIPNRVLSGSCRIRSMISSRVCAVTAFPQVGQKLVPTRANRTRK